MNQDNENDTKAEFDKFGLECFIKHASCMFIQGMLSAGNKDISVQKAVNLAFELDDEITKRFNKI